MSLYNGNLVVEMTVLDLINFAQNEANYGSLSPDSTSLGLTLAYSALSAFKLES
jgi:hypothetical protein